MDKAYLSVRNNGKSTKDKRNESTFTIKKKDSMQFVDQIS